MVHSGKRFPKIKRKRGRPRKLSDEAIAMQQQFGFGRPFDTRRTRQNIFLWINAQGLLNDIDGTRKRFNWLLRYEPGRYESRSFPRKTILYHLGRLIDYAPIEVYADALCRIQPTTREAIKLIKRWQECFHDKIRTIARQRTHHKYDFTDEEWAALAREAIIDSGVSAAR